MFVYVVESSVDYEGSHIESVFKDENKALEECKRLALKELNLYDKLAKTKSCLENLPKGFRFKDEAWVCYKMEVIE